uniref:F-box/LRR-repeat protein 15/At3g58940/PEG3-like LRR domain-containing protein n=1 Tax=Aegilops tauschii TaxID=37682 RepID=R7W3M2_AEGTA
MRCLPADLLDHAKQFNDFFSACLDAFAGLKRLWLRNMRFGESDIPNILSTCKLLESLHLTNCDSGMNSVVQLEHAKLTELEVKYGKFEIVELTCLPKLQRIWVLPESPKLLRPVLSQLQQEDVEWKASLPDFKHKNLVKLIIYGFQHDDIFVRFIRCVMEHAVNMAEISLHDRTKVCLRCGVLDPEMKYPSWYPRNADERTHITEELRMSLPAMVRFWT